MKNTGETTGKVSQGTSKASQFINPQRNTPKNKKG